MADKSVEKLHAKIISRAWSDPAYKKRLLSDPNAALAEEGIKVPAGTTVTFHENTANTQHVVLPSKPDAGVSSTSGAAAMGTTMCIICSKDCDTR